MIAISLAPPDLVGRAAKVGARFDFIDRVRDRDRARALVVRGEPGIDKTSLLTAAIHLDALIARDVIGATDLGGTGPAQRTGERTKPRLALLGTPAQNLRKG